MTVFKVDPTKGKDFVRKIPGGTVLFKEGDMGSTMYIILSGTIDLFQTKQGIKGSVGRLSSGELLGEKALLQETPYERKFLAQATEESLVIEVDRKNINLVHQAIPDFTLRILGIAAERLDRANQLIDVLRSGNSAERFIKFLLYAVTHSGTKVPEGTLIKTDIEEIFFFIRLSREQIDFGLNDLCHQKLLIRVPEGFIVTDEKGLLTYLPKLKETMSKQSLDSMSKIVSELKRKKTGT